MGKNAKRRANSRKRPPSEKGNKPQNPPREEREEHPLNSKAEETDWAETEKRLESQYVAFFKESMSMPEEIAREIFKAFAEEQKEAAQREGTDRLPESFGDILLQSERTDEKVRELFALKRADGVTDDDIAFWWNMHDLERRMICKVDEMNRILLFEKLVQDDATTEPEAARMVAKRFPIYGDPEHLVLETEDDRPLPFELKWRVNRYISEKTEADAEEFKQEVEASTSLNAVLRKALRAKKL
jgi:hypothetical protein